MEVYGTKPKRFTRKWWEYFWDYYKFHALSAVIIIILLIASVNECTHRINYDLQVDYISENPQSSEALNALNSLIEENIDDITENRKKEGYTVNIDMSEKSDPQYAQAMLAKYSLEAGYTDAFVFIMSKKYADLLSKEEIFEEAENWSSSFSYNGYCVSLEDCTQLKEIGFDTSDLYIGVLKIRETTNEKNIIKQENGKKFARFLADKR